MPTTRSVMLNEGFNYCLQRCHKICGILNELWQNIFFRNHFQLTLNLFFPVYQCESFVKLEIGIPRNHVDEDSSLLACDAFSVAYNYQRTEKHIYSKFRVKNPRKMIFVCFNSPKISRRLHRLIFLVCYEKTSPASEITQRHWIYKINVHRAQAE